MFRPGPPPRPMNHSKYLNQNEKRHNVVESARAKVAHHATTTSTRTTSAKTVRLPTAMAKSRSAASLFRLLGIAAALASAACIPTEPATFGAPQAVALMNAPPVPPRVSAYVSLLRR